MAAAVEPRGPGAADAPSSAERRGRYAVMAVDASLGGMSRLADLLEARACLPTRASLKRHLQAARRDLRLDPTGSMLAVILPSTRPSLVLSTSLFGCDRVAVFHRSGRRFSALDESLLRAALARVDLVVAPDEASVRSAVRLGADPERVSCRLEEVADRLFGEPRRRNLSRGLVEMAASLALDAASHAGVMRLLELATPDQGVNVVNYHRILPLDELTSYCRPQMALAAPVFEAQLQAIAERRGFLPVERLREAGATGRVAITFDDGYEDNFRVALPILEQFSAPACIFLVTNLIGRPEALWWDRVGLSLFAFWRSGAEREIPEVLPARTRELADVESFEAARALISAVLSDLNQVSQEERMRAVQAAESLLPGLDAPRTMLSWTEVKQMAEAGVVFGAHTRNHVPLDEVDAGTAKEEIFGSQDDLEAQVGPQASRVVALPRGRLGPLPESELQATFEAVMTSEAGVNAAEANELFVKRRDGRMLTLSGRHHPGKVRLELTGLGDRMRRLLEAGEKPTESEPYA
jgi:hypothetical protein